jgi:hypothetical protein
MGFKKWEGRKESIEEGDGACNRHFFQKDAFPVKKG